MEIKQSNCQGVSLIELLISLAIFIILLTVAVPSYEQYFVRQRINGIGDNLHYLFRLARAEAVKTNKKIWLRFNVKSQSTTQWQVALTDNVNCQFNASSPCLFNNVRRSFNYHSYPQVTMFSNVTSLSIDPVSGRGNAGSVTFKLANSDVKLIRNSFGRHTICTNTPTTNWRYRAC